MQIQEPIQDGFLTAAILIINLSNLSLIQKPCHPDPAHHNRKPNGMKRRCRLKGAHPIKFSGTVEGNGGRNSLHRLLTTLQMSGCHEECSQKCDFRSTQYETPVPKSIPKGSL